MCILKHNLLTKNKIHATSYLKETYSVHFCALSFGDLYILHVSVKFRTILINTDTRTNWNITSIEDKEKLLQKLKKSSKLH